MQHAVGVGEVLDARQRQRVREVVVDVCVCARGPGELGEPGEDDALVVGEDGGGAVVDTGFVQVVVD